MWRLPTISFHKIVASLESEEGPWKLHGLHQTDNTYPVGARAVLDQDPEWDYDIPEDILAMNQFTTCLSVGLHRATLKAVN